MELRTRRNNGRWAASALLAATLAIGAVGPAAADYAATQTPADTILAKGFSAYMDGKDKQALSYFEEVIRLDPKNGAAQKGLQKVKIRLKKAEDLEKSRQLKLAKAKMKEGRQFERTGDVIGAVDAYHAAADAVPNYAPAKSAMEHVRREMQAQIDRKRLNVSQYAFCRGVQAYLDRDWAKAWRIWSERLTIEPNNVALANATARADNQFRKMMLAEKEDFFRRGARAFYEQGLYAEAVESWKKLETIEPDDSEAQEGVARSQEALLRIQGKNRDTAIQDTLEEGLQFFADRNWRRALESFQRLAQLDPTSSTAKEYIARINKEIQNTQYVPPVASDENFRENRPSNPEADGVKVPDKLANMEAAKKQLESQLSRDQSNIEAQKKLQEVAQQQKDESEKIYNDGLIEYSRGNRDLAIQRWKEVLVINPDHKKAQMALQKAKAEEDRSAGSAAQ